MIEIMTIDLSVEKNVKENRIKSISLLNFLFLQSYRRLVFQWLLVWLPYSTRFFSRHLACDSKRISFIAKKPSVRSGLLIWFFFFLFPSFSNFWFSLMPFAQLLLNHCLHSVVLQYSSDWEKAFWLKKRH